MSEVRCVYHGRPPEFPATDQHPAAVRYGPVSLADSSVVFVDAIGGQPTLAEIVAVLEPPAPPDRTPAEKLAAAGLSVAELKSLLGLS